MKTYFFDIACPQKKAVSLLLKRSDICIFLHHFRLSQQFDAIAGPDFG
jgi:hypothetical protein